jgi:hypothetical protein
MPYLPELELEEKDRLCWVEELIRRAEKKAETKKTEIEKATPSADKQATKKKFSVWDVLEGQIIKAGKIVW